jgi:hypothetical protein
VLGAIAIAQALLQVINPQDMPVFEARTPMQGDEFLRAMRSPHSWEASLRRATAALGDEGLG